MFSAHNDHGSMKHEQKSFPESFSIRSSEGRAPACELVLRRGGLHFEIALQRASLESKIAYRNRKNIWLFGPTFFPKLIRNLNKKVGPFRLLAPILWGPLPPLFTALTWSWTPQLIPCFISIVPVLVHSSLLSVLWLNRLIRDMKITWLQTDSD